MTPATFELVGDRTRDFGQNSYLEVSRKRIVEASGEATEFLLITRGFYGQGGEKRWTKFVTVPDDAELKKWLAEALSDV